MLLWIKYYTFSTTTTPYILENSLFSYRVDFTVLRFQAGKTYSIQGYKVTYREGGTLMKYKVILIHKPGFLTLVYMLH